MSDAGAAFGRYSLVARADAHQVQLGNGGVMDEYFLTFWKERFLVYLSSDDTAADIRAGMLRLGAIIDRSIDTSGTIPALAGYLPKEGLTAIKYIRGILALSTLYRFESKNIFGATEGMVGFYPTHRLFLFHYQSNAEAEEQFTRAKVSLRISERYANFTASSRNCVMNDREHHQLCVIPAKNFIVVVVTDSEYDAMKIGEKAVKLIRTK